MLRCPAASTTDQWVVTNAGRCAGPSSVEVVSGKSALAAVLTSCEVNAGRGRRKLHNAAKPQPNYFGLRREAERHAALEALLAAEKRCRRCALPPQSKILAAREALDELQCGLQDGEKTAAANLRTAIAKVVRKLR